MTDTIMACHYFRMQRPLWALMLTRARQLGARRVYTPIPWSVHEIEDGRFDLTGITQPKRDLIGFVTLCGAMGVELALDLTPGPTAGANLLHHGIPGWLLRQYPEVRAKDAAGQMLSTPSFEHPTYLKFVTRWFEQVGQALKDRQAPGGPITGAQVSFDLPPDYVDFNDQISNVQWPIWLRKRYAEGGIEAINQAYGPPAPYRSVSQISLAEGLDSPAFQQDRADFLTEARVRLVDTYAALLQDAGWLPFEAIEPPAHAFQVPDDAIDVGASFQWAMEAPVQADGSLRYQFWAHKAQALAAIEAEQLPPDGQLIAAEAEPVTLPASIHCYRLCTNGRLDVQPLEAKEETAILRPMTIDSQGETDFYVTLSSPDTPLTGFLEDYLGALLAGQEQAVRRGAHLAEQLATALEPRPQPEPPTTQAPMTEAQQSLEEASLALRRAAASIGALEEAFSTALSKPQPVAESPLLLSLDGSQLGPVREACQAAAAQLTAAAQSAPTDPLTAALYQSRYQVLTGVTEDVVTLLDTQLRWLREGLSLGELNASARRAHHLIENVLYTLTSGVLRR